MSQHILIIDDDSAVREAYALALEDIGAELHIADGGEAGIELARQQRPDLVFLDLKMPGMNGVETLKRLCELYSGLTVYIVTAFASEFMEELREAQEQGLHFQVAAKPLSNDQIETIARLNLSS